MVVIYSHAEVQGQQSIGSKDRGNKRTDGGDRITSLVNAVGNDLVQL